MNKPGKHQLNQLIKDNSTSNNILMQSTEKGILLFLIVFLSEMNSLNLYTRKYETNINWGYIQNSWLTYMLQKTSQVALVGKNPSAKCRRCKRCKFDPWFGKIPWRRAWQPTPVFLSGESSGQRSQQATVLRVSES